MKRRYAVKTKRAQLFGTQEGYREVSRTMRDRTSELVTTVAGSTSGTNPLTRSSS